MKYNELKIGNYVQFNGNVERVLTVAGGENNAGAVRTTRFKGSALSTIEAFAPIEITNQTLERLGFEFDRAYCWKVLKDGMTINFEFESTKKPVAILQIDNLEVIGYYESIVLEHIEYVHQLQNLHFALTGKELTFLDDEKT